MDQTRGNRLSGVLAGLLRDRPLIVLVAFGIAAFATVSVAGAQSSPFPGIVHGVEYVEAETASNSTSPKSLEVKCPEGKNVIGGGADVSGPGASKVALRNTHWDPEAPSEKWEGGAQELIATTAAWKLRVRAVCADLAFFDDHNEELPLP